VGHVDVAWARGLAASLLAESLPRRWSHTQGVAAQAETLRGILGENADLMVTAALLHDIGYAPPLVATEFHPLDGARYLREVEYAEDMLCRLVAHHSCALVEAEERGLAEALSQEFDPPPAKLRDALIYCDMTTGPAGERLAADDRINEIYRRYGDEHVVTRSIRRAAPRLLTAVSSTAARIEQSRTR
jgi:putative nucleotidyltransferase with HDIG domain